MNRYSLTVVNDSELVRPQFAVFASIPVRADCSSLSLAWLVQQIEPSNSYTFEWDISWGFTWSANGAANGYTWTGSGTLPADPSLPEGCAAAFEYENGDFTLRSVGAQPDGKSLWIDDQSSIPLPSVQPSSVGVSLSGSPVCVMNAGPNLVQTFTLHPTYYIDAGNYVKGQMVDGASVVQLQPIEYADGVTALTATLGPQNHWTVAPSA